ncbi:apolipoprotein B receptor [Mustela erminea]|uniref:apolipoprotein B receptor n=1 Tax=Mustela erminea TaxID=36723 RepID=UPI00138757EC|nr:apolipoprotein B receptor [Mustela erminea]
MDFLRLHLPGLHQALRGALDSLSSFVSYLMGDEVPTADRKEERAAEELGEVAAGRQGRPEQKEAQEALEGLGGSQSQEDGELRGPREAGRRQEGSSATEQTWAWEEGSSHGSQAERQDTGVQEAAKVARCQEPRAHLEARKESEAGSEAGGDNSSQAQESQGPSEQEVKREETLRTREQEEEAEEVRERKPEVARKAESEWTWHREPEGVEGADGQKVAGDSRKSLEPAKEATAEEIRGSAAKQARQEEELMVVLRGSEGTRAQEAQESGTECEARTASVREVDGTASAGKEGDLSGARMTEYGEVSGEEPSEGTGKTWAFGEASRGGQEEEADENREAEMSFSPKQTRVLGTESAEGPAKEQRAGAGAAEGQGSEGEVREGFEVPEAQGAKDAEGKQTSVIRTVPARLEEAAAAEKAKEEEKGCRASEAALPKDNLANEPEEDADLEVAPGASSPEKESSGERSDGEAQTGGEAQACSGAGRGDLEHEVTEGRAPELVAGPQTLAEQPEEELWETSALSEEETAGSPEEFPRTMGGLGGAEASERQRRDAERGDTQEGNADAEEGEVAGGWAPEEPGVGRESTFPDVPEAGGEGKKAQEIGAEEGETLGAESQGLGGRHGVDAGTGQSLGESDAGETKDEEAEAAVPWAADPTPGGHGRLEEATLSLQDSEDPGASSLAAEIARDDVALDGGAAGAEGGPAREAGEAWGSEGRQEVRGSVELMEVTRGGNRGRLGFGPEGSADEEVAGRGAQAEASEAREGEPRGERVEARGPAVEEGSCGTDGFTSGSQVLRAEGTVTTREAEGLPGGQTLSKEEAVGWPVTEQGQGSEGGCGEQRPEEEADRPLDVEDAEETEGRRAEAEEIVPEGLEDVPGPEDQSTSQEPAEAERGPHRETGATAGSAGGGARGLWSEALLPGALLDVSVPRSRVLLSRNSSLRRSRPSSRRTRGPERQEVPPSPPPEEELSAPEQRLLQAEEPPEPSPPKPEGTPLPARRRPLGHGFGLAHTGMMQELQARLGQPKPQ